MLKIEKHHSLPLEIKKLLSFYILEEFRDFPIFHQTAWAAPEYTIIKYLNQGVPGSFCSIIPRTVLMDDIEVSVAGISNVVTPANFRKQGFSTEVLREVANFIFDTLQCDHGLLLCAQNMETFYRRLDWYTVNSKVFYSQSSGTRQWSASTMLVSKAVSVQPSAIDLCGLPW